MKFEGINHVAIIASDLEKSVLFYTDILGFKEFHRINRPEKDSTIVYLDAKNFVIELFSFPETPKRLSYPEATGLRHLALSTSQFDSIIEYLLNKGIEVEPVRIDERTNKKMTFIFDPDSLPIEISEI